MLFKSLTNLVKLILSTDLALIKPPAVCPGNSQSKSIPLKLYFLTASMIEFTNISRLSSVKTASLKPSAPHPPIAKLTFKPLLLNPKANVDCHCIQHIICYF